MIVREFAQSLLSCYEKAMISGEMLAISSQDTKQTGEDKLTDEEFWDISECEQLADLLYIKIGKLLSKAGYSWDHRINNKTGMTDCCILK